METHRSRTEITPRLITSGWNPGPIVVEGPDGDGDIVLKVGQPSIVTVYLTPDQARTLATILQDAAG